MEMIFSFDTEDYVDPLSNDALLRLAQIHTRHGVPACFGLVGEKARFLRTCGRRDVIAAVARHEVGYHSDHHFILPDYAYDPPCVPEYVEKQPWDRAMARLLAEESRGVRDVAEVFGRRPVTWLRNYGDYAPQYLATFAQLDLQVFAYGPPFHTEDVQPIWYCNQLVVANPRLMYENNLHRADVTAAEKVAEHKRNIRKHLDGGTARLGFVTHPTRFVADTWWEVPNWWDTGDTPAPARRDWKWPPRFAPEKIEELLWIADEVVKFVSALGDVRPRTFAEFAAEWSLGRAWVPRETVIRVAAACGPEPRYVEVEGESFSPAEQFGMFAFALSAPAAPEIPVRRLIGPTREPVETAKPGRVPRAVFLDTCRDVEMSIRDADRVPHAVHCGLDEVGPGTVLLAMAEALVHGEGTHVELRPAPNLPAPLHAGDYERLARGTPASYIQKRQFSFPQIRRASQLQYWTVKPAVPVKG